LLQDLASTAHSNPQNTIALENAEIQLLIRPDLGGRIDQLYDKSADHAWLWHPPTYDASQTRALPIGASFDEHWSGGWDEIFPNDAAGEFREYSWVDHGELWSQSWEVQEHSRFSVKLRLHCQTLPVRVEKTIEIHPTKPEFSIGYQFENLSDAEIPFLFKHHAAIAIEPGDEILLPDCLIEPVVLEFSRIIGQECKTKFPIAFDADGNEVNLKTTRDRASQLQEFFYSSELAEGACGIRNLRSQTSLNMQFDTTDFPYVWMFQSYGGWRDFYVLIAEPCTTMPYDLEIACQNKTVAILQPREVQTRNLVVSIQRAK
jgi:galactose mutarotase-like enzyme